MLFKKLLLINTLFLTQTPNEHKINVNPANCWDEVKWKLPQDGPMSVCLEGKILIDWKQVTTCKPIFYAVLPSYICSQNYPVSYGGSVDKG